MRNSKPTDFQVPVEGVGVFTFGRKSLLDQVKIEAEYARLTEGIEIVPGFLHALATAIAEIRVMAVVQPAGFDIAEMDGEEESYASILKVRSAYREKVASFRAGDASPGASGREGDGSDGGALVPA